MSLKAGVLRVSQDPAQKFAMFSAPLGREVDYGVVVQGSLLSQMI